MGKVHRIKKAFNRLSQQDKLDMCFGTSEFGWDVLIYSRTIRSSPFGGFSSGNIVFRQRWGHGSYAPLVRRLILDYRLYALHRGIVRVSRGVDIGRG
jgi:hypothetical protein